MTKHTRRSFLERTIQGTAIGAGLTAVGSFSAPLGEAQVAGATNNQRAYTAGRYALYLDTAMAGWVQSVEGGNATSDVVVEKLGPDHIQRKHLAGVKYEDIAIHCGAEMSKAFFDWIKATVGRSYTRRNGAIGIADYNLKETARMSWVNGLISEIGFPALDAASKDAARLSVKFAPEYTRLTQGAGAVTSPGKAVMEKKWLSSNFRLQIAGLDCTRVNKIEAFTIKQAVVTNA